MKKSKIVTIHNQDANNLYYNVKESIHPEHIDIMIDNIAASGVDIALISGNDEIANHPSSSLGTYEDMFDGEPSKIPAPGVSQFYWDILVNNYNQYLSLKNHDCDYLKRSLQRCRVKNLIPGISVRMNDMHNGECENTPSHSLFFKNYPEYRITVDNQCFGFNYACDAVRNRMLDYIRELRENYDFDFLELDWIRFATHFYPGEGFKNRHLLTDFMAEIRNILKDITIMARVHQSPKMAMDGGLDIAAWAKSGLIDIVAPCSFFSQRLDLPIEEYRQLTEDRVKIFGCFDDVDRTQKSLLEQPELFRGAIAAVMASGGQGIEFFNQFFGADVNDPTIKLRAELISKMHQSTTFHGLSKEFRIEEQPACWVHNADLPWQLPVEISNNSKCFSYFMAKPEKESSVQIEIAYKEGSSDVDKWNLTVNDYPVDVPKIIPESNKVVFCIPNHFFKTGNNKLLLKYSTEISVIIKSIRIKTKNNLGV